jgi:protein O-GlcNAc transferase
VRRSGNISGRMRIAFSAGSLLRVILAPRADNADRLLVCPPPYHPPMSRGGTVDRITSLISQELWAQAEASLKRALASDRANPDLNSAMVLVLSRQGRMAQAEFYARQTLAAIPDNAHALYNVGNILVNGGKYEEGIAFLERAVAKAPGLAAAHHAKAIGLVGLHRYASAAAAMRQALEGEPNDAKMLGVYAHCLHSIGRVEEAVPVLRRAVSLEPQGLRLAEHLCALISYAPGLSEQEVFEPHVRYGELLEQQSPAPLAWTPEELRQRRKEGAALRIGLISPDLRNHAVSFLCEAILEYAEPGKVFVACYSSASCEDAVSQRLKKRAGLWRSVYGMTVTDAARAIYNDRIDALIDLAGHTNGNRIDVMALKPAPIQLTYMGFPNSTGCKQVDLRVVDSITDPPGDESLAVEKQLKLDPCFLSYRPPDDPPPVSALPCGDSEPVTFAAFSGVLKFNTPMLNMWARVLRAAPGARLLLKHFAFKEAEVREDVMKRLEGFGADPAMVTITPPEPSAREVLPWYHKVDIALDTFPYNGTTTFCESFLMGVPMVSLNGRTPPARVGRSLLTAVGLQDLSASTEDDFVRIAAGLADDRARLKQIRATLRDTFLECSICDGPGFARRISAACERALKRATGGE